MKSRKEIGSITIEATISLAPFIFAFLGITSLTRMIRTEQKVQYALNQSAKEFSQYMYIINRAQSHDASQSWSTQSFDELIEATSQFTEMVRQKSIDYKEQANNSQNIGEAFPRLLNKNTYLDLINCNLEDENITQMYTMVKIQGSVNVNTTF